MRGGAFKFFFLFFFPFFFLLFSFFSSFFSFPFFSFSWVLQGWSPSRMRSFKGGVLQGWGHHDLCPPPPPPLHSRIPPALALLTGSKVVRSSSRSSVGSLFNSRLFKPRFIAWHVQLPLHLLLAQRPLLPYPVLPHRYGLTPSRAVLITPCTLPPCFSAPTSLSNPALLSSWLHFSCAPALLHGIL